VGLSAALQDEEVQVVFLFPGDLTSTISDTNRAGWRQLVDRCGPDVLVIGEYQTEDPFKTAFDQRCGLPAMHMLFPEATAQLSTLGLSKIRSEFLLLGREVIRRFDASNVWSWGPDPTPQVLLSTLSHQDLRIEIVPLGKLGDNPAQRNPLGQLHQVIRYVAALACDRIRAEIAQKFSSQQAEAVYDELQGATFPTLFRHLLEALGTHRSALPWELQRIPNSPSDFPLTDITNTKIGFRRFPGFSLLFDNPGVQHLSPLGSRLLQIACQVDVDPHLELYARLRASLETLDLHNVKDGFFALPAASYHVTVWDGLNADNCNKVFAPHRSILADFLLNLPHSLLDNYGFIRLPESSPLVSARRDITFKFKSLTVWKTVLVALLEPADENSRETLEELKEMRIQLYSTCENTFGLCEWRSSYDPHISLGYFGNEQGGAAAQSHLEGWTKAFASHIGSTTIRFNNISLYGFLDMATYFKAP
jgi:hypothetical protein